MTTDAKRNAVLGGDGVAALGFLDGTRIREKLAGLDGGLIPEDEATRALAAFDPVWKALTPLEQSRVVGLLVERVEYDGRDGKVTVAFHPTGIKALADELATYQEVKESA